MRLFLTEWLRVLACLGALSAAGAFLLRPFQAGRKYLFLAWPAAGICALSLCMTVGYTAKLAFKYNFALSFAGCAGCSLLFWVIDIYHGKRPRPRIFVLPLIFALAVSASQVALLEDAAIRTGAPAINYMSGTDALGYAHVADWLQTHTAAQQPVADPSKPFESWINIGITFDTRFGALFLLAVLSWVRGESGTFSYDFACAVVVSAGILAFAGAFARTRASLLLAIVGVSISSWYDLSRTGYFAKILAYPSALLLASLLLQRPRNYPWRLYALAALTFGASLLHSGVAVAFICFLATIGLWLALGITFIKQIRSRGQQVTDSAAARLTAVIDVLFVCGLCLMSWTLLSRGTQDLNIPIHWQVVLYYVMDVGTHFMSNWRSQFYIYLGLALFAQLALGAIALYRRQWAIAGLLVAGTFLLLFITRPRFQYPLFQALGALYPIALAGAVCLLDKFRRTRLFPLRIAVIILSILMVSMRGPRFCVAFEHWYGDNVPAISRFEKSTLDTIDRLVGEDTLEMQVPDVYRAEVIMINIGKRIGAKLSMDPATWDTLLSYRHWKQPPSERPPEFLLLLAETHIDTEYTSVFANHQYKLLRYEPDKIAREKDDPLAGFIVISGMTAAENPNAPEQLPKVRRATGTATRLRITDESGTPRKLVIDARGSFPKQVMSIYLDNKQFAQHSFADPKAFEHVELPISVDSGRHELELRYATPEKIDRDKPGAILFSALRLVNDK